MSNEGQGKIYVKQLQERLEELGWIQGRNSHIEYRWAAGDARKVRTQAAEMVASRPDVIVGMGLFGLGPACSGRSASERARRIARQ